MIFLLLLFVAVVIVLVCFKEGKHKAENFASAKRTIAVQRRMLKKVFSRDLGKLPEGLLS